MKDYKRILSCWNKMEYFTPAPLPKDKKTFELIDQVPWETPVKGLPEKKTIQYTIYLGVFNSKRVTDFVKKHFHDTEIDENERNNKICLASLKIDNEGEYINDSFGISTLPWALHQLERGNIDSDNWHEEFENLKELIFIEYKYIFNQPDVNEKEENVEKKKITLTHLQQIEAKIKAESQWNIGANTRMYVQVKEVYKTQKDTASSEILNSYYSKDLESIINKLGDVSLPKAFSDYMTGSLGKKSERVDITNSNSELKETLVPAMIPDGSWPSEHSLSLMQQFAVNRIFKSMSSLDDEGLLSVNGPPGTGKTTLLRDIIAPILVKRAKALTEYEDPSKAFKFLTKNFTADNGYKHWLYSPDKNICNAGMVVASSNNGAVENISKELPLLKEVKPYNNEIEYFRDVASTCISEDNWGLISAVLGKKENRNELKSSIWFNKEAQDLQQTLKSVTYDSLATWQSVVAEFNLKLKEVAKEKEWLEVVKGQYEKFFDCFQKKSDINNEIQEVEIKISSLQAELDQKSERLKELNQRKKEYVDELTAIKGNKPNFFVYWLNPKIRKEYKKALNNVLKNYNESSQAFEALKKDINEQAIHLSEWQSRLRPLIKEKDRIQSVLNQLEPSILDAKKLLGANYADYDFWINLKSIDNDKASKSQQSCPWYSAKLKKLQSQLFILALKVNEQFILHANSKSNRILTTLAGFFEYLNGNTNPTKEEIKAMWDTFFLVIPVISSTFASIQTMFKDLDKGDLPWLFVDEAGQAVPQAAAGAIWRSQKVVVVGDPFQIEPVVTIPKSIVNNLGKYFQLGDNLINSEVSVQTIADTINPWGAYINLNAKDVWVGIPLKVHRRCLNPMFKIANSIAYDSTMYSATKIPKEFEVGLSNAFIHCNGSVQGKHYVPEQAEIVKELVKNEIHYNKALPDLFIITPFTEISYKLRSELYDIVKNAISKYSSEKIDLNEWLKTHVGTVHTFQGKEAKAVIMCLGIDDKTRGAASWASSKPNLLNVALTRAKHRFVAIGDKDIWLNQPYFKELSKLNEENKVMS